ncbi:MAG: hypothetical protein AAGA84_04020 [Pseudomonadota bacterium]
MTKTAIMILAACGALALMLPATSAMAMGPAAGSVMAAGPGQRAKRVKRANAGRKAAERRDIQTIERNRTVTTSDGRTAERTVRKDFDHENKSVTTNRNTTRLDGRSASSETIMQRTEDGYTRTTNGTNFDGKAFSRTETGQYDAESQTWTRNAESTGPNGGTRTLDATVERTENGAVRTATRTNAKGESVTRTQERSRKVPESDNDD